MQNPNPTIPGAKHEVSVTTKPKQKKIRKAAQGKKTAKQDAEEAQRYL